MSAPRVLTRIGFAYAIGFHLHKAGWPLGESSDQGKAILEEFLDDEECKFGDRRYAWDMSGAADLATAYAIDHGERP